MLQSLNSFKCHLVHICMYLPNVLNLFVHRQTKATALGMGISLSKTTCDDHGVRYVGIFVQCFIRNHQK